MPLHLLGKKSWNVYNADNIARVRRDEAAAAAEEHAAEKRMQDADAARRLAILRGETPPPLPEPEKPADPSDRSHVRRAREGGAPGSRGATRKRKRAGEDDTEFEMRVAREQAEEGADGPGRRQGREGEGEVSIVDSRGHIDLVGLRPKDADRGTQGQSQFLEGLASRRWYEGLGKLRQSAEGAMVVRAQEDVEAERCAEAPTRNIWGRDDPKRRGREAARLDANDPLTAMRSGARKVRDMENARRMEAEERWRELEQLRQEERRRGKRRKREQALADEEQAECEKDDGLRAESRRSGRSEKRRHDEDERRESRGTHAHREERRRRRDAEHARGREHDGPHGREVARSRESDTQSRSQRDKDQDERRGLRSRDREERHQHRNRGRSERYHPHSKDYRATVVPEMKE